MKKIALIMVLFAFLVFCPPAGLSLEVGDNAPDFSLVDVSGKEITLGDLKGSKNVVLIFYSEHK
jgi:cytochrome oxidase Cu insertion factor (SCO1/SenC/PrrC family)